MSAEPYPSRCINDEHELGKMEGINEVYEDVIIRGTTSYHHG